LSGLYDPADHCLSLQGVVSEEASCLYLQETFKQGGCFWCEALMEVRNKVLIAARAIKMGLDPEKEYNRFIAAGGKYFLDYPVLCP